jgi:polar amino acid transport system substrate-binding protein
MSTSNPYCNNAQVVVVPADKAAKYQTKEALKDLVFAVEAGSAGEAAVKDLGNKYSAVKDQAAALMEVAAGTSDACIIDLLMAGAMIGEGTSYENLTYTVKLTTEEYGVGFKKGSDLTEKLNQFFKDAYADGSMMETAKKYGVQESIIEQK